MGNRKRGYWEFPKMKVRGKTRKNQLKTDLKCFDMLFEMFSDFYTKERPYHEGGSIQGPSPTSDDQVVMMLGDWQWSAEERASAVSE